MKDILENRKFLAFIITMQEAFSAMLPYFLLSSFISYIYSILSYFSGNLSFMDIQSIKIISINLDSFSSIIATIAIAYFFAIRFQISQIIASILSIATFITILLIENDFSTLKLPNGFIHTTMIAPILSVTFLRYLYPIFRLKFPTRNANKHIYVLFNYMLVFFVAYSAIILLYVLVDSFMDILLDGIKNRLLSAPDIISLMIRNFFVQLFWFVGIHGEHTVNSLIGEEVLFKFMLPNLTYGEFNKMFVTMGGVGIGLGLLISLILFVKDSTLRFIAKLSAPFVIFNINNLLIYGAVVLNRFFMIPFILLPLINLIIAYIFLNTIDVSFTEYYISWNTPIFVNSYLKTNGNLVVILFQLLLIVFDTFIYAYFTKKFLNSQSLLGHFKTLEKNLSISSKIKAQEGICSYSAYREIIEANLKLDKIIKTLNRDSLFVYYQPKVNIKQGRCNHFEALLRYRADGKIVGPVFLDVIEKAGLAPIIDIWVANEVKRHLAKWRESGLYPEIGVNIHPDTLKSQQAIEEIMDILQDENVVIEIIERSFLYGDMARKNLNRLKKSGFKIAIDDFGIGYSNLETIAKCRMNEIKIDKSLTDIIETKRGFLVCKHTVNLSKDMNLEVVVEGVERKEQLEILSSIGVSMIQGYYFSPAVSFDEVIYFIEKRDFV